MEYGKKDNQQRVALVLWRVETLHARLFHQTVIDYLTLSALKYHSNHSATLHSLAKLYRQQSHDKAQQFIDGLTPRQYKNLAEDYGYIMIVFNVSRA